MGKLKLRRTGRHEDLRLFRAVARQDPAWIEREEREDLTRAAAAGNALARRYLKILDEELARHAAAAAQK